METQAKRCNTSKLHLTTHKPTLRETSAQRHLEIDTVNTCLWFRGSSHANATENEDAQICEREGKTFDSQQT